MTRPGAMYLIHREAVEQHCLAARTAMEIGSRRQLHASVEASIYHDQCAAEVRSQLAAARKLGLRGSAGTVPAGYFADAPCSAKATQGTPATAHRPPSTGN